ncbi:unnamed protein product [Phytophthora fragariaefolia]|uniref:Unnamed protein product n=1 Tax=Phytophthora fragariaefolia TaxID=1490495 RepID=A0A9W7D3H5_9STRA|nr:unnamed protein product [Phytophthora fragariaefolia]
MGMSEGLLAAQAYGVTDLVVVGDSSLTIQQYLRVVACLKESLLTQLIKHRELDSEALPVEPEPPYRPNDATTESSRVKNGEISPGAVERLPNAEDVDPLEVQEERRHSVSRAQDEELRWVNLKLMLQGECSSLGYKVVREARKMADRFVLSDDGLLYLLGENRR